MPAHPRPDRRSEPLKPSPKAAHRCLIDDVGGVTERSGSVALGASAGLALHVPGTQAVSW